VAVQGVLRETDVEIGRLKKKFSVVNNRLVDGNDVELKKLNLQKAKIDDLLMQEVLICDGIDTKNDTIKSVRKTVVKIILGLQSEVDLLSK